MPGNTIQFAESGVGITYAGPFFALDLLDGQTGVERFIKAVLIHVAHNLSPLFDVVGQVGLAQQLVRFARFAYALRIKAGGVFTEPEDGAAVLGQGF